MESDLDNLLKELKKLDNQDSYVDEYYEADFDELESLVSNGELTPEICEEYNLEPDEILELLEGRMTPEECKNLGFDPYYTTQLIIYYGKTNDYLTPEKCLELELGNSDINKLLEESDMDIFQKYKGTGLIGVIKASGNVEKYLQTEQLVKLNSYNILKLLEETENMRNYLNPEILSKLGSNNIFKLLEETEDIGDYLTPEICKIGELSNYQIVRLIQKSGKIEQYMISGEINKFGLSEVAISELINEYVNEDNFRVIYNLGYNHTILKSVDLIYKNLDEIIELEGFKDKKTLIERLCHTNIDFLKADFNILDDKNLHTLGEDRINQISCYHKYVDKVIQLDINKLKIIENCLEYYQEKNKTEEWGPLFVKIIDNIDSYSDLIEDIYQSNNLDNIELDKIISIFSHDNFLNLNTVQDLNNYDEIKKQKCDELLKSNNIKDRINAISIYIFGQSIQEIEEIYAKYGECIDDIKDENLKYYIKSIEILIKNENSQMLNDIYNNVEPVKDTSFIECERLLKNEYFKLYKEKLLTTDKIVQSNEIEKNLFELPITQNGNIKEFNIIMTSIGAANTIFGEDNNIEDYFESWNRPCIAAQHISGSYIRRDMIETAPISNICYGFCEMSDDALVLAGAQDIASSWSMESYAEHKKSERYYSPDTLINKSFGYNEIDIRRFQNGQRKQPDYIIVFKEDGKINNLEEARKASEQFKQHTGKSMPILVIDKEKCLETEKELVEKMLDDYKSSPSNSKSELIIQKIRNNRKTNGEFLENIDIDGFNIRKKITKKKQVELQDIKECFDEVKPEEREKFIRNFKKLYRQMTNINQKEGNDDYEQR